MARLRWCGAWMALALVGCGGGATARPEGAPLRVVATTAMIGDLVRSVGGERVEVTDLFKPGVDPHTYRPTTQDLAILAKADLVFRNGLHLEGKMDDVLSRRPGNVAVCDRLFAKDTARLIKSDDGHADPHVWFDVSLWADAALVVADALSEADAGHAEAHRARGQKTAERLRALHAEAHANLKPLETRVLVTSHDAFRYFGRAYGLEVRGVQGINTDAEASVRDVAELVDFLVKRQVRAVFVETSVNPRNVRSLVEGCAARGHTVTVGGELFSDAMGDPGTPEGTYDGMIRHNVATLLKSLGAKR